MKREAKLIKSEILIVLNASKISALKDDVVDKQHKQEGTDAELTSLGRHHSMTLRMGLEERVDNFTKGRLYKFHC